MPRSFACVESDGLLADEALIRSEWITGMLVMMMIVELAGRWEDNESQVVQEVKIQGRQ